MNIREPLVHTTYFYLRENPGDSTARRQDQHDAFVADAHRRLTMLAGWLALPAPALPTIQLWEDAPPLEARPLMPPSRLEGRTNVSARIAAYALRNMLLLRVVLSRQGDYEQGVWSLLDSALGGAPDTPYWLHTARYWCGVAPRPPEDLEQERSQPIKTPFGVLCLGQPTIPHLLVYPDARTEARADAFLQTSALRLDWYPVQARARLDDYLRHASSSARQQRQSLEQLAHDAQPWPAPGPLGLRSTALLHGELDALEAVHGTLLQDQRITQGAVLDIRSLMSEYRLALMAEGLWDAAPTVWEAQVAGLRVLSDSVETDLPYIDHALRQVENRLAVLQARIALQRSEHERLLLYLVAGLGLAILAVLVADTSLTLLLIRLVILGLAAGVIGWVWRRRQLP